jgi:uncharacterized membrane protein YkgB
MDRVFALTQRIAAPFLRISLGLIIFWIAALKFVDPSPVVGLLQGSLPFLAFPAFVYVLGVLEIVAALLLLGNVYVRYVGFGVMALFAGTLTIFLVAPGVTYGQAGFPLLSLVGQFLLKDLVLFAAALSLVAIDSARVAARMRMDVPMAAPMAGMVEAH